ncbi:hypothetical protein N7532_009926 [Penicillium argentinense]|uniref:Uncharacterized protein n=1 Tax=Penicillium argentinense TaxID=1131581 RepID=A0A9W9JXJ3_9EURO|nr:uncharacterized protein N7532_009926 [Penicillium argentinense]KAJ5085155.1 hypothetical protein N7532_009926 [Penicillium argentinense]
MAHQRSFLPVASQPPNGVATEDDRPGTPPRPPYSPVTPTFAHLDPVAAGNATIVPPPLSPSPTSRVAETFAYEAPRPPAIPAVFKPEPPPVPISESDNPDAIALRSAISILQVQKQQSLRDIHSLERMKEAAGADPEGFARELAAGRLRPKDDGTVFQFTADDDEDVDDDDEENEDGKESNGRKESDSSPFGRMPKPQNVVRMPPINWSKYHVVGESLDRMHEEQLRRPSSGDLKRGELPPEYAVASPYRPLVDRIDMTKKM